MRIGGTETIEALGEFLSFPGARLRLSAERMAPSTLYDASYHLVIVALAFSHNSTIDPLGRRRLSRPLLRLLQFVSARPVLLTDLLEWLAERGNRTIDTFSKMPRGHLGDRIHDGVVEYLISAGVLAADGDDLVSGSRFSFLSELAEKVVDAGLFERELSVLTRLSSVKIYGTVLAGQ